MGSTRLPGKVMMDIAGKPMLQRVVESAQQAKMLGKVVIAATDLAEDDRVVDFAKGLGVDSYRGSSEDVLERYFGAAQTFGIETVVRMTADCPLIDPKIVDLIIDRRKTSGADYASNILERTFPRGFDVEVFSMESFRTVHQMAVEQHQHEHVTPYYYEHPDEFDLVNVVAEGELRRPDLRLCVDEEDDLRLVRTIYNELGEDGDFSAEDIIGIFNRKPELAQINARVEQKKL